MNVQGIGSLKRSEVMSFEISEFSLLSCLLCAQISKMSIFPSYSLGCYTVLVCFFLINRSRDIQPSGAGAGGNRHSGYRV